jgi:hypothetical protein
MKCFAWRPEKSKVFGIVKRPVAEISLKGLDGNWQPLIVYVDSGADVTVLKRSFGELLKIPIEKGECADFGGVTGDKIITYIHTLQLKLGDYLFPAKVAFAVDDRPPNLLGRMDIFHYFAIHFKNKKEMTCFKK